MANTYYDSQLTKEQIENALEAIDGVIAPANNGKVLAISNGKIIARSVVWPGANMQSKTVTPDAAGQTVEPDSGYDGLYEVVINGDADLVAGNIKKDVEIFGVTGSYEGGGGGSTIIPKPDTITHNGTYYASSDNADGYSQVTVNVSGGGEDWPSLKNYIESSGTQYINSGYSPTANTKFEVIANVPDNATSYPALIGERTSPSNEVVIYAEFSGGNLGLVWANGDDVATRDNVKQYYIGQKCKYILSSDGLRCVINTGGYGFLSEKTIGSFATLPIFIFVLNDNGSPNSVTFCTAKLYRFRIYEDDVLVHEFIPWQDNGVACLKDTVTGNLKYNAGTGDFTYGTDS